MDASMTGNSLNPRQREQLLELARQSIHSGVEHGCAISVDMNAYDEPLRQPGACFVTLHINAQLRGCIGSLQPYRPLVDDVAANAYAAAFSDPRFPPLSAAEEPALDIHISVLSPRQAMEFGSEADLVAQLRPGIDGLVLSDGMHRGTFLPSVWESLPDPQDFLNHLKMKAGLPMDHWSTHIQVERYTTESFGQE
jgi:AmmeMemoRadiSam system protein A